MPFDNISLNNRRVTRAIFLGHSHLRTDTIVSRIVMRDFKPIVFEMRDPVFAATTRRTFPDFNKSFIF
jgi:hypothetical protein